MEETIRIGVIGGTGVYRMEELQDVEEITIDTPFGPPSDKYIIGTLEGVQVAFLPRHGRGHYIMPHELNSRANIWGFKKLGVEYLIAISACGSMKEHIEPGHIVIPDQLFDRTRRTPQTFFGNGLVVHVNVADPLCPYLSNILYEAARETGAHVHKGGTFIIIEGPRFSTKGESRIFRQWGVDIIGMTAIPEAFLAREAEMSYAIMAHVTDYDVWHEEEPVTVEMVIQRLRQNAEIAKQAVIHAVRKLKNAPPSPYRDALKNAIITAPEKIPPETLERVQLLVGKYIKS